MSRASVISPYQKFYYEGTDTVLAAGKIYFKTLDGDLGRIYSDPDFKIPQQNPYTLDGGGMLRGDVRFPSTLDLWLESPSGDPLYIIEDVTCFSNEVSFSLYSSTEIYSMGDIVTGIDGNYYRSKIDGNLNNNPLTNIVAWEVSNFIPGGASALSQIGSLVPYEQSLLLGNGTDWSLASLSNLTPDFLGGLTTQLGADADHDITINAGRCNDAGNTLSMSLASITKRIDATWAVGDNAGGLASGATLANNTWYHLFVVKTDFTTDAMFDTSITCANGAANNGVTHYRRIASVRTNSSANIIPYFQYGDYFYYSVMRQDYNDVGPDTFDVAVSAPLGVNTTAYMQARLERASGATNAYVLITAKNQTNTSVSSSVYTYAAFGNAIVTDAQTTVMVSTGLTSTIRSRSTTAVAIRSYLNTIGYIDTRGQ